MKKLFAVSALITIVLGAQFIYASYNAPEDTQDYVVIEEEDNEFVEEGKPLSGMFFSSEYVTEEYEYDDAYCIVYDDPDANMFDVEICVDLETYKRVIESIKRGSELVGSLVRNEELSDDSLEVFSFMSDPEFEMAYSSANSEK
jgi:hypothetical protein